VVLVRKSEWKRTSGRPERRLGDSNETDLTGL